MSEVITRQQAQEIIAVLSRQKDKHYSSVVAAGSDLTKKEALLKTAVGIRLEDKKSSEISVKDTDNDDQFVTKNELKATIDELLTSQANIDEAAIEQSLNGKDINTSDFTEKLSEKQIDYIWSTTVPRVHKGHKPKAKSEYNSNSSSQSQIKSNPASAKTQTTTNQIKTTPKANNSNTPITLNKTKNKNNSIQVKNTQTNTSSNTPAQKTHKIGKSLNNPITKLNLDGDPNNQTQIEQDIEKLVNLDYQLSAIDTNSEDIHLNNLSGTRTVHINDALEKLTDKSKENYYLSFDLTDITRGKVGESVLKTYLKDNPNKTEIHKLASKAISDNKQIKNMTNAEKEALEAVFKHYKAKLDKFDDNKLKDYLKNNFDHLKNLGIPGIPTTNKDDIDNISDREALIQIGVDTKHRLKKLINDKTEEYKPSVDDNYKFMEKYYQLDTSDKEKLKNFIENLSDKELILLNRNYPYSDNNFITRDFILKELAQHDLSLEAALNHSRPSMQEDLFLNHIELLKEQITDPNELKTQINKLLDNPLFKTTIDQSIKEHPLNKKTFKIRNSKGNKLSLNNIYPNRYNDKFDEAKIYLVTEEDSNGKIISSKIYNSKAEFFNNSEELYKKLGLDTTGLLNNDKSKIRLTEDQLLRISENGKRLTYGNDNTISLLIDKIYENEEEAIKNNKNTEWHQKMKDHIASLLLSKSPGEYNHRLTNFKQELENLKPTRFTKITNKASTKTEDLLHTTIWLLENSKIN